MPLGFATSLLAFYPGVMTYDSESQFFQARHFEFGDWHPPIMALIWSGIHAIVPDLVGCSYYCC